MVNRVNRHAPAKKKSTFVYRERTAEDVKKRAEREGTRFDSIFKSNVDTYKPKVGDNLVRILPPTWEAFDHYAYSVYVHRNIGADNSTYLCPNKMLNKKCPICAAAKEAKDAGEEDEAKALRWNELCLAWVIDRDEEEPTPRLWSMTWTIDRDIVSLCQGKRSGGVLLIDHPDEGYDVSFVRRGQGLHTKYSAYQIDRDPSPICTDEDKQQEILDYITENPIPETLKFYDFEHLQNVLNGSAEATDEGDDDQTYADADEGDDAGGDDAGEDGAPFEDGQEDDQYPDDDDQPGEGDDDQNAGEGDDDQYAVDEGEGEGEGDAGEDDYIDEPEVTQPARRQERPQSRPRVEARPASKQASRPASRPVEQRSTRPAAKPAPRPQPKPQARVQPKPQARAQTRAPAKPQGRVPAKPQGRPAAKPQQGRRPSR